jgi:hypothetical protein
MAFSCKNNTHRYQHPSVHDMDKGAAKHTIFKLHFLAVKHHLLILVENIAFSS